MKRLLLTVAAATAIMLTACIDVELASSGQSSSGERVRLITISDDSGSSGSGDAAAQQETGSDSRRGDAAHVRSATHDDVRARH